MFIILNKYFLIYLLLKHDALLFVSQLLKASIYDIKLSSIFILSLFVLYCIVLYYVYLINHVLCIVFCYIFKILELKTAITILMTKL